ncbi:MAG: autotransporter outer membrane beta-barrel domain-containing protein [Cohaesibacter sp.]|nr:autotransporter outer membrane beta-barrel domain-containing protein [Cohaesibacter sp.]
MSFQRKTGWAFAAHMLYSTFLVTQPALASPPPYSAFDPDIPDKVSCSLLEYFQFIYRTPTRPFDCTGAPPAEFFEYQRDVGENAASGSSSGGASSGASSSVSAPAPVSAPASVSSPAQTALFAYQQIKTAQDAQTAISSTLADQNLDQLPPLERSFFITSLGSLGRKNAHRGNASVKIDASGLMAGLDFYSDDYLRFGLTGSATKVDVDINENVTSLDIIQMQAGLTGTFEWQNWYADGLITLGADQYDTSRFIDIDGKGDLRKMQAHYTNYRIQSALEVGHRLTIDGLVIQPFARLQGSWLKQSAIVEDGNPDAAVHTAPDITRTGDTKIGVNLSSVYFVGDIPIVPTLGLSWTRRFGELSRASRVSIDQGKSFENLGTAPLKDVFNISTGLSMSLQGSFHLNMAYAGSFNHIERSHSGTLGLRYSF